MHFFKCGESREGVGGLCVVCSRGENGGKGCQYGSIVLRLEKKEKKSGTESRIHEYKFWCRSGLLQGLFESFITIA